MLTSYAAFLNEHHLPEFTRELARQYTSLGVPAARSLGSEETVYQWLKLSTAGLLDAMSKGRGVAFATQRIEIWLAGGIPEVPSQDATIQNISLALSAQKRVLITFLPRYSWDQEVAQAILQELEVHYQQTQEQVFELVAAKASRELAEQRTAELHKEREFLAVILENLNDGIVACDAEGKLTLFNRATREFHGLLEQHLASDAWASTYNLYHADGTTLLAPDEVPLARAFAGEQVRNVEIRVVPKDGAERHLICAGQAIFGTDGHKLGAVVAIHDVTDMKRSEQEIARKAEELLRVNERLREVDRYKDEFFGIISHELRTPLNVIIGFANLLNDEHYGPLINGQGMSVARIVSSADRMLALVDDLLDYSRIQAGLLTLAPKPTPYRQLVEEVATSLHPLAAAKELTIQTDVQVEALPNLDEMRIKQVLINLAGNAIKFTPVGGQVVIRASLRGDELVTEVQDNGIGIPPHEIYRLFDRFTQVDSSSTREVGGTGLGLAITKALVEAHHGRIGVESGFKKGSTFWFTLPLPAMGVSSTTPPGT